MAKGFVSWVVAILVVALPITPAAADDGDATIEIWHGVGEPFGTTGTPQRWANVTGRVSDPDRVAEVRFRIGDGDERVAGLGPDDRRLVTTNSFNLDLTEAELRSSQQLVITVEDLDGDETTRSFTVRDRDRAAPAIDVDLDWSAASSVDEVVDVVDGHWELTPDGLRTVEHGYDRLVVLGDLAWDDYEVLVPMRLEGVVTPGPRSGAGGLGVILRWQGHNTSGGAGGQPIFGFRPKAGEPTPFGSIAWVRLRTPNRFELMRHDAVVGPRQTTAIDLSDWVWLRASVETNPDGSSTHRLRVWEDGTTEPGAWTLEWTSDDEPEEPAGGSLGLLAHEADVTFGRVRVGPPGTLGDAGDVGDPGSGDDPGDGGVGDDSGDGDGGGDTGDDASDDADSGDDADTGGDDSDDAGDPGGDADTGGDDSDDADTGDDERDDAAGGGGGGDDVSDSGGSGVDGDGGARVGYWTLGRGGAVTPFGDAGALRSVGGSRAVDIEAVAGGAGVLVLTEDGVVHALGAATALGDLDLGALAPGERPSALMARPDGEGYWVVTDRGRVAAFGTAVDHGGVEELALNATIVAAAATATGDGYYLIGGDGGVFAFGDAEFRGSTGSLVLNQPVVDVLPDADGVGYLLVAADGGVFAFDASFVGSLPGELAPGTTLNAPIVSGITYGDGYLLVGADGGVFVFGDLPFLGSLGGDPPTDPVVGVAAFADLT
ncbi:MAG: hypothetical protein AAFZ07_09630 [Actinomycetota bacterium]